MLDDRTVLRDDAAPADCASGLRQQPLGWASYLGATPAAPPSPNTPSPPPAPTFPACARLDLGGTADLSTTRTSPTPAASRMPRCR